MTTTVRPLPQPADKETRAGGYFVSNYPPFAFWTPQRVGEAAEALDRAPAPDTPLGLYVHIPFCRRRCHFCYFKVYTDRNAGQIGAYNDAMVREMQTYAESAFIGGRTPQFVYFGGGTPSYLSAQQLLDLTAGLKDALSWNDVEEVTFECEPGTLNEKKLAAIRDMGVTRLSLGIENFTDHILEANNRAHLSKQVHAAHAWARSVGFPQINVDLIAGMLEETEDNWLDNVRRVIDLAPDSVTIYQMEIPFNTTIYQQMQAQGRLAAPVADWDTKRRWVKYAFAELEKAGYAVSSAYTVVKNPDATRFVYRDSLWRGADLIGIGVASFGHINRTHYQNEKHIDTYVQRITDGQLPLHRALAISDEEAMIRELVLQMKLGRLDLSYFHHKFNVDVLERFAEPIERYRSVGFLSIADGQLLLDRDALLQVDHMLREFFLPQHADA